MNCCISFDSYIKPQLCQVFLIAVGVVYLLIPTSNHNPFATSSTKRDVVYLLIPTSNHNFCFNFHNSKTVVYLLIPTSNHNYKGIYLQFLFVVYLLIPTSNHNYVCFLCAICALYIFWFLHQTTTSECKDIYIICCISFDSYIKPQLVCKVIYIIWVVYLLIPTSNHNDAMLEASEKKLYIFWFLHQTTTTCI